MKGLVRDIRRHTNAESEVADDHYRQRNSRAMMRGSILLLTNICAFYLSAEDDTALLSLKGGCGRNLRGQLIGFPVAPTNSTVCWVYMANGCKALEVCCRVLLVLSTPQGGTVWYVPSDAVRDSIYCWRSTSRSSGPSALATPISG